MNTNVGTAVCIARADRAELFRGLMLGILAAAAVALFGLSSRCLFSLQLQRAQTAEHRHILTTIEGLPVTKYNNF